MNLSKYNDIECYKCGVLFGVSPTFDNNRRDDKAQFFCPNGHSQAYVKSTAEQLRETLETKNRLIESRDASIARLERELKKCTKPKKKK